MSRSLPQTLLYSGPRRTLQSRLIAEFSKVQFSKAGREIAQQAGFDIVGMQNLSSKEQKDAILNSNN